MTNTNPTNNDSPTTEEESYYEELATIVFQSALMRYLASEDEFKAEAFNVFIETHPNPDSFLEDLCNKYPEFEKLLREEMLLLQKEIDEVVPD